MPNKFVEKWNRIAAKPRPTAPDGLMVDGDRIVFPKEGIKMSQALPKNHLNNILRLIKRSGLNQVEAIRTLAYKTRRRLGVKRDLRTAAKKIPKGSNQCSIGSIASWMKRVDGTEAEAVRQVVAIDATATQRICGR